MTSKDRIWGNGFLTVKKKLRKNYLTNNLRNISRQVFFFNRSTKEQGKLRKNYLRDKLSPLPFPNLEECQEYTSAGWPIEKYTDEKFSWSGDHQTWAFQDAEKQETRENTKELVSTPIGNV